MNTIKWALRFNGPGMENVSQRDNFSIDRPIILTISSVPLKLLHLTFYTLQCVILIIHILNYTCKKIIKS